MLIITYTIWNILYRISFSLITASKRLFMHLNGISMLEFIKISKHILRYQLIIVQVHFRSEVYLTVEFIVKWTVAFTNVCCRT